MEGQLLSLKWENHKKSFSQTLTSIRKNYSYYDVTIVCYHKTYKAHKLVLSTCSEFLEEVLERTCLITPLATHPVIVLNDMQPHYFEALLDYMYIGEVDVLQKDLPGLIKAAEILKVKGLAVPEAEPSNNSKWKKRSLEEHDQDRKRNRAVNSRIEEEKLNYHINEEEENKKSSSKNVEINVKNEPHNSPTFIEIGNINEKSNSSLSCSKDFNSEENKNSEPIESSASQNSHIIKEEVCQIDYSEELFTDKNAENNEYFSHDFENSSVQESIDPELDLISQGYCEDPTRSTFTGTRNSQQTAETFDVQSQDIMNISYVNGFASDIQQNTQAPVDGNDVWIRSGRGSSGQGVTCPYCMKVFTRKSIFIYHYKTHTGEKPFGCPHCPRRFIQKGNMESHARTHITEKSSQCPHCPQIFTQRVYLMMHINEVHMQQAMS